MFFSSQPSLTFFLPTQTFFNLLYSLYNQSFSCSSLLNLLLPSSIPLKHSTFCSSLCIINHSLSSLLNLLLLSSIPLKPSAICSTLCIINPSLINLLLPSSIPLKRSTICSNLFMINPSLVLLFSTFSYFILQSHSNLLQSTLLRGVRGLLFRGGDTILGFPPPLGNSMPPLKKPFFEKILIPF